MLFVNWWLSLEVKAMTAVMQLLRQFYRALHRSNDFSNHHDNDMCLHTRNTPVRETSSAPAAEIAVLAEDSMALQSLSRVNYYVPTGDDSRGRSWNGRRCFILGSHIASADPLIEDVFMEEVSVLSSSLCLVRG
jgi:hypothetical protein